MTSSATQPSQGAPVAGQTAARRPLAQLLHALNQPLTGLQCSMEVALAAPRTPEQYVRGLREGLELTERMRALVEAIREVVDLDEEKNETLEITELKAVLRETVDDLKPVAEAKKIRLTLNCSEPSSLAVRAGRRRMVSAVFRLLESALSLSARDNELLIETGSAAAESWLRIRWRGERLTSSFSRPELGLLIAQASLEQTGAVWQRERTETSDAVNVLLPSVCDERRHP